MEKGLNLLSNHKSICTIPTMGRNKFRFVLNFSYFYVVKIEGEEYNEIHFTESFRIPILFVRFFVI